jgi:hypothetical protein
MEMDYYDYNVINASAAPGSYLGMDPAFLVWIPPIDDGKILSDSENEEILPTHSDVDPGSNKESPEEDEAPQIPKKPPRKSLKSPSSDDAKSITSGSLNPKEILSKINFLQRKVADKPNESIENFEHKTPILRKPDVKRISAIEKETSEEKSPGDNKISEYYELSDIKFADDEEEVGSASYSDTAFQVKS